MKHLILAIMVLAAPPALAQIATADTNVAGSKADKKVCRREVSTGSIMPGKRTCHTVAEWRAIDDQNEKATDTLRNGRPNAATGSIN